MYEGALRALEFARVAEVVRGFSLTPLGTAALARLHPFDNPRAVQDALTATSECVAFVQSNGSVALHGPDDLDDILGGLAIAGRVLEGRQLLGLAHFLASVDTVRSGIEHATGGPFPTLLAVIAESRSFETEVASIRRVIDQDGTVGDHATPELRTIRDRLRKQRNRLRSTLESYLRGKDTARYLQDQVVSERGGRFVLLVRAEHRSAIPGIVHGSSGTGATLFLEPLSTVEINNEIVALEDNEAAEVRRVLLELAGAIRRRALDLRLTLDAATAIDTIQARAGFAALIDGVEPALAADTRIVLPQARHPLLIPAVRRRLGVPNGGADDETAPGPVPVDLVLEPPTTTLVVTGPNTGGKTVALKTAGLLSLMAQAGLHIPAAAGATVTIFKTIFADIGDEQSLSASLSTFSGHVANIVSMDRHLDLPALVLLDEVGAGTDPVEGGALGAAIIDHFKTRGALVLATTHDDMLKSYASTTDGVTCAGFGFDPATFAPTYRLTYGSPGRSLALEIASRLGLAPAVIDDARQRRSARESQLADHLERIDRDLRELESQRGVVRTEARRLAAARETLESEQARVRDLELKAREQLRSRVESEARTAREKIDAVVQGLRRRVRELEAAAPPGPTAQHPPEVSTSDSGALRREARAAVDAVVERVREAAGHEAAADPPSERIAPPVVGSHVLVQTLGIEGDVRTLHGSEAEVEVRGKRLRVPVATLRTLGATPRPAPARVTINVPSVSGPLGDLNVIGCTVDDAVARASKYLDQALLHEQRRLRVIHGHGKGHLRRAIAAFLIEHPLVSRFAPAPPEQGGGGVTEIELKD
jgi:DNA mismatch repair protein MutS2